MTGTAYETLEIVALPFRIQGWWVPSLQGIVLGDRVFLVRVGNFSLAPADRGLFYSEAIRWWKGFEDG